MARSPLILLMAAGLSCAAAEVVDHDEATRAGLESLRRNGSDLSRPHPMTFYLDYTTEAPARAACDRLGADGYETEYQPPDEDVAEHTCAATILVVPSFGAVRSMDSTFHSIAVTDGGTYGSWYAPVVN